LPEQQRNDTRADKTDHRRQQSATSGFARRWFARPRHVGGMPHGNRAWSTHQPTIVDRRRGLCADRNTFDKHQGARRQLNDRSIGHDRIAADRVPIDPQRRPPGQLRQSHCLISADFDQSMVRL